MNILLNMKPQSTDSTNAQVLYPLTSIACQRSTIAIQSMHDASIVVEQGYDTILVWSRTNALQNESMNQVIG